jgi:hypothetical protein
VTQAELQVERRRWPVTGNPLTRYGKSLEKMRRQVRTGPDGGHASVPRGTTTVAVGGL